MIPYIGDYHDGRTVRYMFNTTGSNGASIAPTTLGTVKCYKDNTAGSVNTSGITTSQFNSLVGVYSVSIDLTNAFYVEGADYTVILEGSTIDGQSVTTPLFQFSIANRYDAIADAVWLAVRTQYTTGSTMGHTLEQLRKSNFAVEGTVAVGPSPTDSSFPSDLTAYPDMAFDNQVALFVTGVGAGMCGIINGSYGTDGLITLDEPMAVIPAVGDQFVIVGTHVHSKGGIADTMLGRLLAGGGNGNGTVNERTVRSALRAMRNKVSVASNVMTVYQEDDTTVAWSGTLSNTADVTVDPNAV